MGALLETIHSPADLKRLNFAQMAELAEEIRAFLIQTLSKTGGAKAVSVTTRTSVRLPIIPGTKNQRLLRSGLYHGRGASSTDGITSINCGAMRSMRSRWILLRKAQRDLRNVARGNQRGIRVGCIHNHLQRRRLARCAASAQIPRRSPTPP